MTSPKLAIQLYTLREHLDGSLKSYQNIFTPLGDAGYVGVELFGPLPSDPEGLKGLLHTHGLELSSSHVSLGDLQHNLERVISTHKTLENTVLILPWIEPKERPETAQDWYALGQQLTPIAAACAAEGMTLEYHNHDFEMVMLDGQTGLDHLLQGAGEGVGLELDIAWVVRGGQDPQDFLTRYKGRVGRVHVKDMAPEGKNLNEDGWTDVGHGTLSWETLLPASQEAGATWFIVEHDKPSDAVVSAQNSIETLQRLGW